MAENVSVERFSLKNGHGNFQLITPVHGFERLLKALSILILNGEMWSFSSSY
jgi:hypothetical protein